MRSDIQVPLQNGLVDINYRFEIKMTNRFIIKYNIQVDVNWIALKRPVAHNKSVSV